MTAPPEREGLFTFVGRRFTKSKRFFVSVSTIVEVRKVESGLIVAFMGSAEKYPIELFDGEWRPVRLKSLMDAHQPEHA